MNPRHGLTAGAVIAAVVGLFLAVASAAWFEGLLDVSGADATTFLVRRYEASATVALFVVTAAIGLQANPQRAVLLALSAWFGVQGVVALSGVVSGTVGGLAWAAVFADPLIAAWFFALSGRFERSPSSDLPSPGSTDLGNAPGQSHTGSTAR